MLPQWTSRQQTQPEEAPQQTPHSPALSPLPQSSPPRQHTPPPQLYPPRQRTPPEEAPQQNPPSPQLSPPRQRTPPPPPRQLTPPPPPHQHRRKRSVAAPMASSTIAKKSRAGSVKKAPAKLPYDMTEEETKEIVAADVKRQLAPTHPDPTEKIDPVKARRLLENLTKPPPPPLLSNYDRSIVKSYRDPQQRSGSSSSARGKQFPSSANRKTNRAPRSRCLSISLMIRG